MQSYKFVLLDLTMFVFQQRYYDRSLKHFGHQVIFRLIANNFHYERIEYIRTSFHKEYRQGIYTTLPFADFKIFFCVLWGLKT